MLVAAGEPACAHLRMRHADIEQGDGVIGNRLRFLRFSQPKVASRSSVAMVMFSCAASSRNSPCSLRFSVRKPMPFSMAARGVDHHRFAVHLNHAAGGFAHAEDQLRQLRTPGADQPCQPDDFTGANLQTARLHFLPSVR